MTADRDSGAALLAAYLDQRCRMGDPGLVPAATEPGELARCAAAARTAPQRSAKGQGQAAEAGDSARSPSLAPAASASSPDRPALPAHTAAENAGYDELRELALACTRCSLSRSRARVAFSDGNPKARLMVVGEAPGAEEDRTGLPFVGQAGKLLDLMLASVGLSRKDSVYICNVLKCRPPGNRNPAPEEIESCAPFLKRQLELVAPEVVLATGMFAAQWLTRSRKALGKLRGEVHRYQGVPLVVTYHPAALLRNPNWSRLAWDDLQLLLQVMDRERAEGST